MPPQVRVPGWVEVASEEFLKPLGGLPSAVPGQATRCVHPEREAGQEGRFNSHGSVFDTLPIASAYLTMEWLVPEW